MLKVADCRRCDISSAILASNLNSCVPSVDDFTVEEKRAALWDKVAVSFGKDSESSATLSTRESLAADTPAACHGAQKNTAIVNASTHGRALCLVAQELRRINHPSCQC
jgi:hypothetical protein